MLERDGYLPGVPCWIDTSQPDPEAAVAFYGGLFGWDFEDVMPPGSDGKYFIARLGGGDVAAVGSQPEGGPPMAVWNTYIWVESADEAAAKVKDAGGRVVTEPFDVMDAGRMAVCHGSRRGRVLRLAGEGAQGRADRQRTRLVELQRPEHPRRGRREVLLRLGVRMGDARPRRRRDVAAAGLRRLPGAERSRAPQADGGGRRSGGLRGRGRGLNPITDDQPDVPAHWSVTFAVDDADATADRAAELGGQVVVPPFDAPWVRMTVITDPQGATFTASKFVPENKDLGSQVDSTVTAA